MLLEHEVDVAEQKESKTGRGMMKYVDLLRVPVARDDASVNRL